MERLAYTSDLTDEQWKVIERLLPPVLPWGRPREYPYREILNGLFYWLKNSVSWRNLPHDLPPWSLVHYYYHEWRKSGLWKAIHDELVGEVRKAEGRDEEPSAGVIDSQSVKTTETAPSPETAEKRGSRSQPSVTMPGNRSKVVSVTSWSTLKD